MTDPLPAQTAGSWKRALLPALPPLLVSLILSACTVGKEPYWQDSPGYLVAIKEYSLLYPPGFVLYLSLCKGWTLLLGFVDFTLAVHLFSSLCAALAAGCLTLTAERLTKDRAASIAIGCLAAAGYNWWLAGILAKGYALYFLLVSLLLWRMSCRDVLRIPALLGLAWAAHPSAALLGPAVLLYLGSRRAELRTLGAARIALSALAGLVGALGPTLLLPLISARESIYSAGDVSSFQDWLGYVFGSKFTSSSSSWGFDAGRWLRMGLIFWEEFLGVGLILVGIGVGLAFRRRLPERGMLLAWILPLAAVAALFRVEGQYDFWLVVAWMPLWLAAALGLSFLKTRISRAPAVAAAAGLIWAVAANGRDLYLRGDDLPEKLAQCLLQHVDPGAILVVSSDESISLPRYLQVVRGIRTDVRVVPAPQVTPAPAQRKYLERLARAWPGFALPDFDLMAVQKDRLTPLALTQAAIVNAQKPGSPAIFFDREPPAGFLGSGSVVPAGFLWKWSEQPDLRPEPRHWDYPITLEEVVKRLGRQRGISVTTDGDDVRVTPQAYEERFIYYLSEARRNYGDLLQRAGTPEGYARSAEAYQSLLRLIPGSENDPRILYPLGLDLFLLKRPTEAAPLFQRLLQTDAGPLMKAGALFYLGELHAAARREKDAGDCYRRALDLAPFGSAIRSEIERRLVELPQK